MIKIQYEDIKSQKYSDKVYDKTFTFVMEVIKDFRTSGATDCLQAHEIMLAMYATIGDCLKSAVIKQLESIEETDCKKKEKEIASRLLIEQCVECAFEILSDSLPIKTHALSVSAKNLEAITEMAIAVEENSNNRVKH